MNIISVPHYHVKQWAPYKSAAQTVAAQMELGSYKYGQLKGRAERMARCAERIIYEISGETARFAGTWLCRDRLCPVCSWRLSIKRLAEMLKTVSILAKKYPKTRAIHVVLTIENCAPEDLRPVVQQISKGFTRLRKLQIWKDYVIGYMRSIEVTWNEETQTYHPHIHVVCIVPDWYTRQIGIGDWRDAWANCCRLNYLPIVYARHAYARKKAPKLNENEIMTGVMDYTPEDGYIMDDMNNWETEVPEQAKQAITSAVREAIKYAVKPETITKAVNRAEIPELALALNGIRMVSYGGVIKTIRKELGFTDHESPDRAEETEINLDDGIDRYYLVYEWAAHANGYVGKRVDRLPAKAINTSTGEIMDPWS